MAIKFSMDTRTLFRRLARSRWVAIGITLAVLLAWLLFLRGQLDALREYEWQIAPLAFGVSVAWGAIYFVGLAFCWALLLRHIGRAETNVALVPAARIWLRSMMTRYIPGNIWHVLSRVALAHKLHVSATHVLTSASVEQVLTLLGALSLFGITLPFWSITPDTTQIWLLLLVPIGLLLLHPRIFGTLLSWAANRLQRPELAWQYTYGELLLILLAYIGATFFSGLALFTVLWGLATVQLSQVLLVTGAAALAWAVGYLSFLTPSGLGVREALLVALLAQIYPLPVAIVASLLFRLVSTLGELLAVGVGMGYARIGLLRGKRDGDERTSSVEGEPSQ
jgi:hypothetical protein